MTDAPDDRTRTFVVDRREGRIVVLMSDDGGETVDVEARALPPGCRAEGAVLRVRVDGEGRLEWATAVRDRDEEQRRLDQLAKRVARLRSSDPGGDVTL